jgi:hypothetical protein
VYGYRHYTPKTGQFLGRDPIEEKGGNNLYGFVRNDAISKLDALGLKIEREAPTVSVVVDKSSGLCSDRSGKQCCCEKVVSVILYQIYPLQKDHFVGHAFMLIKGKVYGHYPDKERGNKFWYGAGINNRHGEDNDNLKACESGKPSTPKCLKKTFHMCPKSRDKIQTIANAKIDMDYCILNPKGSPTCKGWVDQVMDEAGFPSNFTKGWIPGLGDNNQ